MHDFLRSQGAPARIGYVLLLAVTLFSVVRHAMPDPNYYPVDFKYFWLAGSLWADGVSPYGADLQALGNELFSGERINPFFYPPSWRLVTEVLSAMPPDLSESVWAWLSAVALALAAWVCALIANHLYPDSLSRFRVFVLAFAAIGGAHAVEVSIQIGQPAPFLLLAFAMLLYSSLQPSLALTVAAMTVLLLKPQLGIPLALACVFVPSQRAGLAIAVALTGALAIYGLGAAPMETFTDFLGNISLYSSFPENAAITTSGPVFLFGMLGASHISAYAFLAFAIIIIAAAGFFLTGAKVAPAEEAALFFLFFAAAAATTFMPTHNFDFLVLAPLLVLAWGRGGMILKASAVGLFLTMRAMSLSLIARHVFFADKTVNVMLFDTIGSFAILAAAGASLYTILRSTDTTPAPMSGLARERPT